MQDLNQGLWNQLCSRLNALWQTDWAIENQAKNLNSTAHQDSKLGSLRHKITSWLNAHSQTHWAVEDQAKNLNSIARPYDEWEFSPFDSNADLLSHLALAIYMFVCVNFDALAQARDFRIERRQVVLLCWMQNSKLGRLRHHIASTLIAHSQTHWAIEDQAQNLNSVARPNDEQAFSPIDWKMHIS